MLELKITGANAQELAVNALQALSLVLNGVKMNQKPVADAASVEQPSAGLTATEVVQTAEPLANPPAGGIAPQTEKPRRGRPAKAKQVDLEEAIAAAPKKPAEMPEGGDPIPDFLDRNKATATPPAEPEAKTYTVEDCRNAVRQVYANFEKRARDAGETDETKIMADKITYTKPLVYGFGIQKLPDLKPEQFAAFMAAAQPYIDGTVKPKAA